MKVVYLPGSFATLPLPSKMKKTKFPHSGIQKKMVHTTNQNIFAVIVIVRMYTKHSVVPIDDSLL
jgi:hypothetical protein